MLIKMLASQSLDVGDTHFVHLAFGISASLLITYVAPHPCPAFHEP